VRGNPPGKNGSYGDAITWETLLAADFPHGEGLHLITADSDYVSPLQPNTLQEVLLEEWKDEKWSRVRVYASLVSFFKARYPDIALSEHVAVEFAVRRLERSSSFAATHKAVRDLNELPSYSIEHVQRMIATLFEND